MENNPTQTHNPANPVPIQNIMNQPVNGGGEILSKLSDDEYFKNIPPGYQFRPNDTELIVDYLIKKINNEELPRNRIYMVKLYEFNPENLAERFKAGGKNEWYFFTPRDKKYRGGSRPNRAAGDGYWKANGGDKPIKHNGEEVGCRKSWVYYQGKPPNGAKTNWIMQEFRVKNPPAPVQTTENSMRLDDWVLCKLYKKISNSNTDEVVKEEIQIPKVRNSRVAVEEPQPLNVDSPVRFFSPAPISMAMTPPMYPEHQNHILGNGFSSGGDPQYPMNHKPILVPGSQDEQIHGTLEADSSFLIDLSDLLLHSNDH
ncbi:hypothetical protein Pfo_029563 [Paulownia fortunei]|nr:hypothetical protein Pfo_029563 [Paulownia fortunei]